MKLRLRLLLLFILIIAGFTINQVLKNEGTQFCKGENCLIKSIYNCESEERPNMVQDFRMPGPETFMITTCQAEFNPLFDFEKNIVTILNERSKSIRYSAVERKADSFVSTMKFQSKWAPNGGILKQEDLPYREVNLRYCFVDSNKYNRLKIIVYNNSAKLMKGGNAICESYRPVQ